MWRGRCLLITNPARGTAGKSWGKAPSPVPPPRAESTTEPNLPATKVTQTCIPQEVERKSRCSSLMVLEGCVSPAMASWMGTGPSMSARSPPDSALSCGCCCHLAARRANAVQVHKPAYSGKALELAQPHSSLAATHPTGLQTRCSNPSYLRGWALRQHLGTSRFGWTFGKVQPTPRLTPGSRSKQKVNKKGKRKALTNTPAHAVATKEASWPGEAPLFKNSNSFCTV